MSCLAPTSTPLVGSSRSSTPGRRGSHLASTTFCWLPPLRLSGGTSIDAALMPQRVSRASHSPRSRPSWRTQPVARRFPRQQQVLADRQVEEEPLRLPHLGLQHDATADRVGRRLRRERLAIHAHRARVGAMQAEDGLDDFGAPGADEAEQADDLALAHLQVDAAEMGTSRQSAHVEADRVADLALTVARLEVAPDHRADDVVRRLALERPGPDVLPIAKHRHGAAQAEHFGKRCDT